MSNGLSQEEINALIAGSASDDQIDTNISESDSVILTDIEKDVLGEVGNISMGSASTALSDMIGKRVNITTPVISVTTLKKMRDSFEVPNIALEIKYTTGIVGKNILIMRVKDAAIVANLMMGGSGEINSDTLSEIEESAVSEAMNQMIGSAATAMATMFSRKVDISPPKSKIWDSMTSNMSESIEDEEPVVEVAFKLNIENLLDSVIMQVVSLETVKKITSIMMGTEVEVAFDNNDKLSDDFAIESKQDIIEKITEQAMSMNESELKENVVNNTNNYSLESEPSNYKIQKVEYKQFSDSDNISKSTSSVFDVPLNIQVVLGETQRSIEEILNFRTGTLLELNSATGQPVELQVNGKVIAHGEVVVVNGNLAINIIEVNNI